MYVCWLLHCIHGNRRSEEGLIKHTMLAFTAVCVNPGQLMGIWGWATPQVTNVISVYTVFNLFPFPQVLEAGQQRTAWNSQNTPYCPTPRHLCVISSLFWECPPLFPAWWTRNWPLRTFSWKPSMTSLPLPTPTELINHLALPPNPEHCPAVTPPASCTWLVPHLNVSWVKEGNTSFKKKFI